MFQRSRGTYPSTSRKAELRVLVQVPGGEVGVEERGVELRGREPVEQRLAGREPDDRVVLLREGHRAGHDPDPLAAEVGQRADCLRRVAGDDQPEPGAGVGDAPGHVAGRARSRAAGRPPRRSGPPAGSSSRTRRWRTSGTRPAAPGCGPPARPPRRPGPCGVPSGAFPVRGIAAGTAQTVSGFGPGARPRAGPGAGRSRRDDETQAEDLATGADRRSHRERLADGRGSAGRITCFAPRAGRRRTGCCRDGRCGARGRRRRRTRRSSRPSRRRRRCTAGRRGV